MKLTVGVDEVGRGPLAGPVAVGAFVVLDKSADRLLRGVRESKQLSEKKREEWFAVILKLQKEGRVDFAVSFVSEKVIDSKGISHAIRIALRKSLTSLRLSPDSVEVLLDGGLKAPVEYTKQKTIIRGDTKIKIIALASICAKVLRDRLMVKHGKRHPLYGFEVHKGYGTKKHIEAIRTRGILTIHRQSFLKNLVK